MNLNQDQLYIDKTEELQKGIEGFPFVYIEGFAACGKSTAVKMLLEKYPEAEKFVIDAEKLCQEAEETAHQNEAACQDESVWNRELEQILQIRSGQQIFVVFENMNRSLNDAERQCLTAFLQKCPENVRVIFVGSEHPDECLLPYLWKHQLEIIPQEALLFSRSEIQKLITEMKCSLSAGEVYEETGGWAGCVDVMLRLACRLEKYSQERFAAAELRRSYEVEGYIQSAIMSSLGEEEKNFLYRGLYCPFVNEKLCEEVLGISGSLVTLQRLRRKGILKYNSYHKYWKCTKIFRPRNANPDVQFFKELAQWYAKEGYVREAISCIRNTQDEEAYMAYLQTYYNRVEPLDIPGELVLSKRKPSPEMCYLQGMYNYLHQDFYGLDREIVRLEKMETADAYKKHEILLNLYYLKPDFTLENWIKLLAKYGEMFGNGQIKFKLYHMLGYSHTYLCGLRDLTGLFACLKKEENQNARIWKTFLGEEEWKCYQLAKIDYYLETERQDKISDEEWNVLYATNGVLEKSGEEHFRQENNRARLYLAGKLMKMEPNGEHEEQFANLRGQLKNQLDEARVTKSIIHLYSRWTKDSHLMTHWLRYSENIIRADINEQNYTELCFMMKGYLMLNQFEKTERIIRKMIPYLQKYHRTRLLAEILFQQAVVNWEMERHGQALQNTIESFMAGAQYRYVRFYTNYGVAGEEVLEAYEDWCRTNIPEKWHRKKKYQYGNVLRMPEADYVGVILRLAHKGSSVQAKESDVIRPERLTMMETMVLQSISRGSTNAQICKELNLKLPTVKTHIYSIYKKLGVGSRVQAVNKGKEMGIV